VYLTGDEPLCGTNDSLTNQTAKLSYQINPRYKLIGFYQRNAQKDDANGGAGKFRPKEAALILDFIPTVWKAELQATPNPRLLVNLLGGYMGYASIRHYQPGADVVGNPSRFYRETGLFAGPHSGAFTSLRTRAQGTGSVADFPKGSFLGKHELKAGFSYYFGTTGRETASKVSGNYLLTFDRVGGVSNRPVEITTYNYPVSGAPTRETELGICLKDSWAITRRLTANVGLRADRFHAYVNAQTKEQGTFGAVGSFESVDILRWMFRCTSDRPCLRRDRQRQECHQGLLRPSDTFHNIEATLNKRNRNKWDMMLTLVTKNHRQIDYVADSPNENLNRIDNTWEYLVKLTGSYRLPWGVQFAAFYTQRSGNALQRTYVFRATDPDGGTPLRQQTTVTARVGEYGALRLPTGKLLSLRASKDVSLGSGRRVTLGVDLFNALNSNAAQAMVVASGPTFGSITQVTPPRIARFGATFKF
jgi:TonB dependent receptor